jgi:hypothetical protein
VHGLLPEPDFVVLAGRRDETYVGVKGHWKYLYQAIEKDGRRSIGCPHQEGTDYDGEWCPVCEFWHRRDRFTGHRVH